MSDMSTALGWISVSLLVFVSMVVVYQWTLAVVALVPGEESRRRSEGRRIRFLVLIPAHNEEASLPEALKSIESVRYPKELFRVVVVADRCDDNTAAIARRHAVECLERCSGPPGKGAAIAWAIGELTTQSDGFDALMILDADTVVDPYVLEAFHAGIVLGHQVQQAYNYISNPWETPFTSIIAVTSVLRNGLFYAGKVRIGLSGMLMGTGMCFSRQIIERHGWTAYSVGEDWEFSVSLLLNGEKVHFNRMARVLPTESRGFRQASAQRLRWASGRYAVAASNAWKLFRTGLLWRRLYLLDAALTLVAPNYSTQATLAILGLVMAWCLSGHREWQFLLTWAVLAMASLTTYFFLGVVLTDAPLRTLRGISFIPIFLLWRMMIEALGFIGYGRKRWIRTRRTLAPRQEGQQ